MYRIKTLNKISPAGLSVLDQTRYTISTDVDVYKRQPHRPCESRSSTGR